MLTFTCVCCGGTGQLHTKQCKECYGTGQGTQQQLDNLVLVFAAARNLWLCKDGQDVKALYYAWRDLGVALAHTQGRLHISEG